MHLYCVQFVLENMHVVCQRAGESIDYMQKVCDLHTIAERKR